MLTRYKKYLFEYPYAGSHWGIEIVAKSQEEAQERLKALGWAKYQGEVHATIKASPSGIGWVLFITAFLFCIALALGVV